MSTAFAPSDRATLAFWITEQPPRATSAIDPSSVCPRRRLHRRPLSAPDATATTAPVIVRGRLPVSGAATPNELSAGGTTVEPTIDARRAKKRDELVAATVIASLAAPGESIDP